MSNQIKNHIVLARETVWGTPVTPSKLIPVNFTGGIQTNQDIQMVSSLKAKLPKNFDAFVGNRMHEGDYEMAFYPDTLGYLLMSAFGADTITEPEAGVVYKHEFNEAETKPSLTIEQKIGENVRRFAGGIAHTLKVSSAPGEVVVFAPSLMAKSQAFEASPVTPAPTNIAAFDFAQCSIEINDVALTEIQNFEIEFRNNLQMKHTLGANDPRYNYVQGSEVVGSLEGYLDATTLSALVNKFHSKDFVKVELIITGVTIGASSNYKFEIAVPKAVLTTCETPLGDEYNFVTVEFEGIYDSVSDYLTRWILTNLTPAYT